MNLQYIVSMEKTTVYKAIIIDLKVKLHGLLVQLVI